MPTKRAWKSCRGLPPGPEEALLGPDEADGEPVGAELAQLGKVPRVLRGVGDDEIRAPQRQTVDLAQDARGGRARREAAAVLDERVVERDERVEDDRPSARDPLGRGQVEVARDSRR